MFIPKAFLQNPSIDDIRRLGLFQPMITYRQATPVHVANWRCSLTTTLGHTFQRVAFHKLCVEGGNRPTGIGQLQFRD